MKKRKIASGSEAAYRDADGCRSILLVDNDGIHTDALKKAWSQLRLANKLHVFSDHAEALRFLRAAMENRDGTPVGAVVLDPDAMGEEAGAFLRAVRSCFPEDRAPVVLWTRDRVKYEALEGCGANAVLTKPMVLRVVQELDTACRLQRQLFAPFAWD